MKRCLFADRNLNNSYSATRQLVPPPRNLAIHIPQVVKFSFLFSYLLSLSFSSSRSWSQSLLLSSVFALGLVNFVLYHDLSVVSPTVACSCHWCKVSQRRSNRDSIWYYGYRWHIASSYRSTSFERDSQGAPE